METNPWKLVKNNSEIQKFRNSEIHQFSIQKFKMMGYTLDGVAWMGLNLYD